MRRYLVQTQFSSPFKLKEATIVILCGKDRNGKDRKPCSFSVCNGKDRVCCTARQPRVKRSMMPPADNRSTASVSLASELNIEL